MSKFKIILLGLLSTTSITLVGQLFLSELFSLINFPFIKPLRLIKSYNLLYTTIICMAGLLFSQIISDIYNNSEPLDYLRTWAVLLFSILSTIYFVHLLSRSNKSIIYYFFALFFIKLIFGEGDLNISFQSQDTNYFKVRFVGFLNAAILLILFFLFTKKKVKSAIWIIILFSLICFILDARSNGLIYFISGSILIVKVTNARISKSKIIVSFILVSIVFYSGYTYYVNQVLHHGFGGLNSQNQLAKIDNPYNPFELLIQGRQELYSTTIGITEKPLLGHGSWAKDPGLKYAKLLAEFTDSDFLYSRGFIPTHSILLTSWLWSGVSGFLFLLFLFRKLLKSFLRFIKYSNSNNPIMPILVVLTVEMTWHFLFSPYGQLRIAFPLWASLIIVFSPNFNLKRNINIVK